MPMVVQRRWTTSQMAPLPHKMDRTDSQDNRSVQSLGEDDCEDYSCPQSLFERMSSPDLYAVAIIPTPSSPDQPFSCDICTSLRRMFIDHNTPDCPQFICFVCETTQPDHFPKDCPNRPTAIIPSNMID